MEFHVVYRQLDGHHVFTSRDLKDLFVTHPDLATAYGSIPGTPAVPVDQFVAWVRGGAASSTEGAVQSGPVVLAANNIRFTQNK